MERRAFQTENEGSVFIDICKISVGVFIGSLAAIFAYEAITAWRVEQAAKKVAAELQRQAQKTNAQLEQQRLMQEQSRIQAEREATQNRAALALADRLERERKARKDAAWNQFYTASPACKLDSGTHACANEYMAARKRFEAGYVDR